MNIQSEEKVVQIPISQIQDFPEHPYKVKDDESMNELVDSIMQRGLIQPVIIRPTEDGNYEMVSGHRRKRAFEIAGMKTIPARVKEMTKDEAILAMVDSNLQREVILASATGTYILAAADGTVISATWHNSYGYYVKIKHNDTYSTLYAHCSALLVSAGQTVKQGQVIAQVGSTGYSTGPHLHFEIIQNGVRVDALRFWQKTF